MSYDANERTFQLADIGADMAGQKEEDIVGHKEAFRIGFITQNRNAGLQLGGLNVGHHAPFKARDQTLLKRGDFFGWAITRNDNLLSRIVKGVEGIEKLLLGAFFVD